MGSTLKMLRWLMAALLALALVACGGDEAAQEETEDPGEAEETAEPEDEGGTEETEAEETGAEETEEPEESGDSAAIEEFYSDNSLTIQVGFGEGGGYDTATRLLSRHYGRHLPGNPDIVVINNPGGGSVNNANECFNRVPADGSVICVNHRELINAQLFGQEGMDFDLAEFGWIGGIGRSQYVSVALSEVAETGEAALDAPLVFGATAPGTSTYGGAVLMNELLGKDYDIVPGYADAGSVRIALEGGEVNAAVLGVDPYFVQNQNWIDEGFTVEMMVIGREREDRLPDVPTIYEFIDGEEEELVADLFTAPGQMGYAFSAPPEMSEEMLQAHRDAFQAMLEDPEFQADAEEINLDYSGSPTGEEIEQVIADVFATPQEDVETFADYMQAD